MSREPCGKTQSSRSPRFVLIASFELQKFDASQIQIGRSKHASQTVAFFDEYDTGRSVSLLLSFLLSVALSPRRLLYPPRRFLTWCDLAAW